MVSDDWSKKSFLAVEWATEDDDGNVIKLVLEPLNGKDFVKAFSLFTSFADLPEKVEGESDEDFNRRVVAAFGEGRIERLFDVACRVISGSYPNKPLVEVERFVSANLFDLIEPINKLVFRQSKKEGRRL